MKAINKRIALNLKTLRHERGWSLDKAAEETGVSKAMLGQIERGESSPTVATLWKIASGLQTSFSSFIDELSSNSQQPLHRKGQIKPILPEDTNIHVLPLFPYDKNLGFELYIIELLPGYEHLSPPHKHGVIEHVITIEGRLEILVEGNWHSLKKNEGLRFDANQPHGYRNPTAKTVRFHNIVHYTQ